MGEVNGISYSIGQLESSVKSLHERMSAMQEAHEKLFEISAAKDDQILMELQEMNTLIREDCRRYRQRISSRIHGHQAYHARNEHLWGAWKLMKKNPVLSMILGGILVILMGISTVTQLLDLLRKFKGF